MYHGFHKRFKQHNCFQHNDNKKKCLLSTKSAYSNDFWRIMWPVKVLKFQLCYQRN